MKKEKKTLKRLRRKIDNIDSSIIKLLNKRADISQKIGSVKRAKNIDIYAPDRESEVYQKVAKENRYILTAKGQKR